MLGFRLPRNFEHPYAARSMRDFWRRWHISLSSWFRDYVYIPLGGSPGGQSRTYLNLLAVWVLTGLWHGSTLNFLLWGLFLFVLIALERAGWDRVLDKSRVLSRVYMVLMIPLSWLLFAIPSVGRIGVYLGRLFPIVSPGGGRQRRGLAAIRQTVLVAAGAGHRVLHSGAGEAVEPHSQLLAGHGDPGGAVLGLRILHVRGHQRSVSVLLVLRGQFS